jgi:hypothetical protein
MSAGWGTRALIYNLVEMKPSNNPLLAAVAHIACCGGPLLIIAVVAGAISLADVAIGLAAIGAIALVGVLWFRRCRTCAPAIPDHEPVAAAPERDLGRAGVPRRNGTAPRGTSDELDPRRPVAR